MSELVEQILERGKKGVTLIEVEREGATRAFNFKVELFNSHGAKKFWEHKRANGVIGEEGKPSWKYFRSATWLKPVFVELSWSKQV